MTTPAITPIAKPQSPTFDANPSVNRLSDDQLLYAIAHNRDEVAFSRLFKRYRHVAYNLAQYLIRDPELAEEAVQEAMLGIWFSARGYKPGNAKRWILSAVSRKCMNATRGRQRRNSAMKRIKQQGPESREITSSRRIESNELVKAIRTAIGNLQQSDCQLIALHYGAGLSQRQIARELNLPQRTVSGRIQSLLKGIKKDLGRMGFEQNMAAVTSTQLASAMLGGGNAPTGMTDRFYQRMAQLKISKEPSLTQIKKPSVNLSISQCFLPLTLLFMLTCTAAWYAKNSNTSHTRHPASTVASAPAPKQNQGTAEVPPKHYVFEDDFNAPELNSFWNQGDSAHPIQTGAGVDHSQLILQAGSAHASTHQKQLAEVYSPEIILNGKYLNLELISGLPTGAGKIKYGFMILDNQGQEVYSQFFQISSLKPGGFAFKRNIILNGVQQEIANPVFVRGRLPASNFKAKFWPTHTNPIERRKNPTSSIHYTEKGASLASETKLSSVRCKIFVSAQAGSWIRWPLDRFILSVHPKTQNPDLDLDSSTNRQH